jgi:hypothetical protein
LAQVISCVAFLRHCEVNEQYRFRHCICERTAREQSREQSSHLAFGYVLPGLNIVRISMDEATGQVAIITCNEHAVEIVMSDDGDPSRFEHAVDLRDELVPVANALDHVLADYAIKAAPIELQSSGKIRVDHQQASLIDIGGMPFSDDVKAAGHSIGRNHLPQRPNSREQGRQRKAAAASEV